MSLKAGGIEAAIELSLQLPASGKAAHKAWPSNTEKGHTLLAQPETVDLVCLRA
jgi:hypothetical protein